MKALLATRNNRQLKILATSLLLWATSGFCLALAVGLNNNDTGWMTFTGAFLCLVVYADPRAPRHPWNWLDAIDIPTVGVFVAAGIAIGNLAFGLSWWGTAPIAAVLGYVGYWLVTSMWEIHVMMHWLILREHGRPWA